MDYISHLLAKYKYQESIREARRYRLSRQAMKGKQHRTFDQRWGVLRDRLCDTWRTHRKPSAKVGQPDNSPQNLKIVRQERREQARN